MTTMTQPSLSTQLKFLKDSARLLNAQSPSTSAHLMAVHNRIISDQPNSLTTSQKSESCPTCGSIRIPGVTCKVFTRSQSPKQATQTRKRHCDGTPSQQTSCSKSKLNVIYECMQCHRETVSNLQKPPRYLPKPKTREITTVSNSSLSTSQRITPKQSEMDRDAIGLDTTTKPKVDSGNASSKRRAKARNKQGLLASLAAGKQSQQTPSNSLDLLDFFKTS